jgi:hypothetical protein
MKTLKINKYEVLLDDTDYDSIVKHKWHILRCKCDLFYAAGRPLGSAHKKILMHRYIMGIHLQKFSHEALVDHIDGNGLNNTRSNLRIVDHSTNLCNRKSVQKNSILKIRGIQLLPSGQYRAFVCTNRRFVHVGCYSSIKEAIFNRNQFIKNNNLSVKETEDI